MCPKIRATACILYLLPPWWYRMSSSVRFFLGAFFLDALYVFESLKCMHIYLNLVKINCFLDIFQNNFIKIQSSNVPSCPEFWTGFLLMYFVLIINHIWWTNKILQVRKVSNRAWYLEVFWVFFSKRLSTAPKASFFQK